MDFDNTNYTYKDNITNVSPINRKRRGNPRLIMSSIDLKKDEFVTFDSDNLEIDANHVIACAGFPFYSISLRENNERYLWDGSLLSNTPSKRNNRFVANEFQKKKKRNFNQNIDIWHRARDIIHICKTDS